MTAIVETDFLRRNKALRFLRHAGSVLPALSSADVPVMHGMATVEIQGVHAGQLVVKHQLHVSIPGYWSLGPKAPGANLLPGN